MRKVIFAMGMPISIEIKNFNNDETFIKLEEYFKSVEDKFSPYIKTSEINRYNKDKSIKVSDDFLMVKTACEYYEKFTNGYFSADFDGKTYNPTGFVKGWAVKNAAEIISSCGYSTYFINAGGDIVARSDSEFKWHIGIQHPLQKNSVLRSFKAKSCAVATSGYYEKGKHVVNPKTSKTNNSLLCVTVVGPDIEKTDVLATTLLVMGKKGLPFINSVNNYSAILFDKDLKAIISKNFQYNLLN